MDNLVKHQNELESLAKEAAALSINAATSAQMIVMAELLKTLIAKGVLDEKDVSSILARLNAKASATANNLPAISSALSSITLHLGHAFGLIGPKKAT